MLPGQSGDFGGASSESGLVRLWDAWTFPLLINLTDLPRFSSVMSP
jgi:hypothetical protein